MQVSCARLIYYEKGNKIVISPHTNYGSDYWHGVKVGPGPRDPGPRDPPQSLKVGPETPLKFKSGTPGPPSKFKSRIPGPLQSLKVGPPHLSLMNSFFSEYFIVFLSLCLF